MVFYKDFNFDTPMIPLISQSKKNSMNFKIIFFKDTPILNLVNLQIIESLLENTQKNNKDMSERSALPQNRDLTPH